MERTERPVVLEARLPAAVWSAAAARHALDGLEASIGTEALEHLRLLVTELVTNAYRHGGLSGEQTIAVVVRVTPDRVRVEVTDPGRGFEAIRPEPDPSGRSGWGLFLVDSLARRWGVERDRHTCVWFELDRDASLG